MRLVYLVPNINNEGGVARVLSIKTQQLIERWGYEIHIITQNNGHNARFYAFPPEIHFYDIQLKGNALSFLLSYKKQLNSLLSTIAPDVVVISDNGLKAFLLPFIISKKWPTVFEAHGSRYVQEQAHISALRLIVEKTIKQLGAKRFTKFVSLSPQSKAEWGLPLAEIIPNPLWFTATEKASLQNKKVIVVARDSYEKGLDRLLLIWKQIQINHPDWILEIYGAKSSESQLQTTITNLDLTDSVHLFDAVKNIQEQYLKVSICLMTSRTEGFPMVILEAMESGLPVIAYDCPIGPRTLIENEVNGYLIPDGQINLFVEQLSTLMDHSELRYQLGNNAVTSVQKYQLEPIMNQWNDLFTKLKRYA
ncbi:glycosyltransferase [Flavobacterium sp. SUN046]|uniref:glycosyltransferase n=1 Tax=Flavobacterium sp. SUN046 TaxID=3002440 RepID=UPI002DBC66A4|nr:glycosyltransferase [Flavobacterium sp. SUN046]MEC4050738.1 glycosyltransferase [Flavobacterium sp. SUN046]